MVSLRKALAFPASIRRVPVKTLPPLDSLLPESEDDPSPADSAAITLRLSDDTRIAMHDLSVALGISTEALAQTLLSIALKVVKDRQSPPLT